MRRIRLTLLVLFLSCYSYAQESILERLSGNWSAKGSAFGMPADITMNWEPALAGKFYRLQYKMIMTTQSASQSVFEGVAYYKNAKDNTYIATWFDSQGNMHPITASSDATTLTSLWGTPETQQGKTTYRLINDKEVEVTDYILRKDDTWSQFNQNMLLRSAVAEGRN